MHPYRVAHSPIHGLGVFAIQIIMEGEMIECPGIKTGHHNFRGFNHSCDPNLDNRSGISYLKTLRTIQSGEELTVDYFIDQRAEDNIRRRGCNCQVCRAERNQMNEQGHHSDR